MGEILIIGLKSLVPRLFIKICSWHFGVQKPCLDGLQLITPEKHLLYVYVLKVKKDIEGKPTLLKYRYMLMVAKMFWPKDSSSENNSRAESRAHRALLWYFLELHFSELPAGSLFSIFLQNRNSWNQRFYHVFLLYQQ